MEKILQDLKYGVRMLGRSPGFTAIAILSLALGIGANTTIFTVINGVLLNPLPVKEVPRLMEVDTIDSKTQVTAANLQKLPVSYPNYKDLREQNDVFTGLSDFSPVALTLSGHGEPKQLNGVLVSANYFDVLGVNPILGRTFLPEEDQKPGGNTVAVVSYGLWAHQFGSDPNLVGQTITLNAVPYTVVGIAPQGFRGTFAFAPADLIWIPISMNQQVLAGQFGQFFNERRALFTFVFGRLKPGVNIAQADAEMKTIAERLEREYPVDNQGRSLTLTPLADATVGANFRGQFVLVGTMMMAVVGLVLLIACANLANLLLAQAAKRDKEMSLRAALGATPGRLMRQLLTETMLISVAGGTAGLLVAYWGRTLLWSFRPPFLQNSFIDLSFDSRVLSFTLGISLFTGLLFGLFPALKISKPDINEALKVGGRGGTLGWRRNRFRSGLVIVEVALSLVALVGAGLFVRSMQFAQQIDPGFESKRLFFFTFNPSTQRYVPERGQQYFRDAIERARAASGVEAAAVASVAPLGGSISRTVYREGEDKIPGKRGTLVVNNVVSTGYFDVLRIPMHNGRDFNDLDREDTTQVAIINQAMAVHFWPNENPLGKRFVFFGDTAPHEIVGVVGNSVVNAIGETPQPVVYLPVLQNYTPGMSLLVRTKGDPNTLLATVRSRVQELDRNLALTNVNTIGVIIDQGLWAPRMGALLLSLFGLLAMALAASGIYGVMAYNVTQRTQEVGIRMALGAEPAHVLKMIIGEGMLVATIGLVGGLAAAFALTRFLSSLLFGVSASDPLTFVGVAAMLAVVALCACLIPARRAMRVDPIVALRYE